jgi:hypothetical protein
MKSFLIYAIITFVIQLFLTAFGPWVTGPYWLSVIGSWIVGLMLYGLLYVLLLVSNKLMDICNGTELK